MTTQSGTTGNGLELTITDPQLIISAKDGDVENVSRLLANSVDANVAEADGTTALHWAAFRDDLAMAKSLVSAGADADPVNSYGATPLWLACTNKSTDMVKILLEAGADPNALLWSGESVLMNCARTGAVDAVNILLSSGAETDIKESTKGQTAIMWAAANNHTDVVNTLIRHGADVKIASNSGFTPLLFSASSGDIQSARLLLEAGADPNEATDEQGNSLVVASAGGHEALALMLLEGGADPNSADGNGITALHHSIREGLSSLHGVVYDKAYRPLPVNMPQLARALLDAGADPNARIKEELLLGPDGMPFSMTGATPFLLAAVVVDIPMMQMLRDYGADPQLTTSAGISPLMAAAHASCTGTCIYQDFFDVAGRNDMEQSLQAVKLLVEEYKAEVNAVNNIGRTAMHYAAYIGSYPVVKYLAEKGALINVKDSNGETPWSMASGISPKTNIGGTYRKHVSTAELLLELGAEPVTYFAGG